MRDTTLLRAGFLPKVEQLVFDEHIRTGIKELFRALTTVRIIDEWGGGPSRFQGKLNGRYSLWDGEVNGTVKEFIFPTRLVYTFRDGSWEENWLDSLVTWDFKEDGRGTRIHLVHSALPTRKIREIHNDAWGECVLGPVKAYLERQ